MKPSRFSRGRKSKRQMLAGSKAALDYYADSAGKPRMEIELPPERKARVVSATRRAVPLEKDIQKAIMQFLKSHPKVAMVWRQNSGTFQETDGRGNTRFIRANSARGMADIMGVLKNGRALAIEVKRPGAKVLPHQQLFLDSITEAGGLAFVARSVDDVIQKILDVK